MNTQQANRVRSVLIAFRSDVNGRDFSDEKLCKLLYLLDIRHLGVRGTPVTGLKYITSDTGPRALQLPDFATTDVNEKFDDLDFTQSQLTALTQVMHLFNELPATSIDVTQHDNGAYRNSQIRGEGLLIDLIDSIQAGPDHDFLVERAREHMQLESALAHA